MMTPSTTRLIAVLVAAGLSAGAAGSGLLAQTTPDATVRRVSSHAGFKAAMAAIDRDHDRLVNEIIRLTEVPAPPFKEAARAKVFAAMLRESGLTDTTIDAEGNVIGVWKGTGGGPLLAIAAHLDTVFPEGTDVTVKRDGTRLMAPGIGDDTRGLAVILAMVRAMREARLETASDILFIGDVGEEGQGDLRGMKYLFLKGPYRDRIRMFVSIDGAGGGNDITHGAVGSKRYRVTFKGPGGHSYGAFGLVNPAFAMGKAMDKFSQVKVPASPRTTYSVGVVGGGTSVNSIPFESWMEIDMRSVSPTELAALDKTFRTLMQQAADEENAARSTAQGRITVDLTLIGDRPSGETAHDSTIVQTASAVVSTVGMKPSFSFSSTDSNIPISLGIPAITIDSGGRGGRAHALDEWIDVEKVSSLRGIQAALLLTLSLAGVK
jgi:acetylornithine deacetylase/succinyl-diaminopimelate desuccinylase-like protein